MQIPSSTYRIQFNKDYTFSHLEHVIDYLHHLGITTIYASPIVKATPASMHGYDVTDPHTINPEVGSLKDLERLASIVRDKGMYWLQDIVPNHMAFSTFNTRLMDVLERGPKSPYYNYFDINWNHPSTELNGKLMVPFLGNTLDGCLEKGEIVLGFSEHGFTIDYFDNKYPVSLPVLERLIAEGILDKNLSNKLEQYVSKGGKVKELSKWLEFKTEVFGTLSPAEGIEKLVAVINQDKQKLKDLLDQQYYRLAFWKNTEQQINYRRFFTVNELICLRMEDDEVFNEYHQFLYSLYKQKLIHGLRIDHIDGLNDPSAYIKKLVKLFGDDCYIIAEKILEAKEEMPEHWPLHGTSGYEFLSYVNQLFTNRKGAAALREFYNSIIPGMRAYDDLVFENKKLILENHMRGEWGNLIAYFFELELNEKFERESLKQALALFMLCLPVYRIYPDALPLRENSLTVIKEAFEKAKKRSAKYNDELEFFEALFVKGSDKKKVNEHILLFLKRLMQFTGPLTAKGVEDTTFYVYNPLISHDEVGDAPSTLGISVQQFHLKMEARQKTIPFSLNATATHDTKRGEDSRLRLNVLSELPDAWINHVQQWFKMNEQFLTSVNNQPAPVKNDEYFIYQSIVGGFPEDFAVNEQWLSRLEAYIIKVVREAKVNSNWESPNQAYEEACKAFIRNILNEKHEFLNSFIPFIRIVGNYACIYAIAQVLVKVTAPGIPDIYQGAGLWELSYVDPDNRRPVDYQVRKNMFNQIEEVEKEGAESLLSFLKSRRFDGYEKLFVTQRTLNFRKQHPDLFLKGEYVPLVVSGAEVTAMAYARVHKDQWVIVIVPLDLVKSNVPDFLGKKDHLITLPPDSADTWRNIFTQEIIKSSGGKLSLSEVLEKFPIAFLVKED